MKMKKGFTLIELMIVVAIIGVLAAVAIPKFANLIRKANEASAKGQLGAVRSALSIYYGDQEGTWPLTLGGIVPTYIQEIPSVKPGSKPTGSTASSATTTETNGASGVTDAGGDMNAGGWWFNMASAGTHSGELRINITETDTKGSGIHIW